MNERQQQQYLYYSHLLKALLDKVQPCGIVMEDDGKGNKIASCYATQINALRSEIDEEVERDLPLAKGYLCCAKWSAPGEPCQHWSPQGCRTECLACRTWLCKPALRKLLQDYHSATPERQSNILNLIAAIQEANGAIRNYDLVAKPHNSFAFCSAWKMGMGWED